MQAFVIRGKPYLLQATTIQKNDRLGRTIVEKLVSAMTVFG
jgi:hypothetical protein